MNPEEVQVRLSRVRRASPYLIDAGPRTIAQMLSEAGALLKSARSPLGARAREQLARSTNLCTPLVDWALRHCLPNYPEIERALLRQDSPEHIKSCATPNRPAAVVLAGNIFAAAVRAVFYPLLAMTPVVVKTSSQDPVFPGLIKEALSMCSAAFGDCVEVLHFAGGNLPAEQALFDGVGPIIAYGTDKTLTKIRGRLRDPNRLIGHGHGVGVAYISSAALTSEEQAISFGMKLAEDIVRYDQRGCLSPQVVWVEERGRISPKRFAELLSERCLTVLDTRYPRGILSTELLAQSHQWCAVALARGALHRTSSHAVAFEGQADLRFGPGYRHILVLACHSQEQALQQMETLGSHLKCVGIGGMSDSASKAHPLSKERVSGARRTNHYENKNDWIRSIASRPRICALGEMQRPSFDVDVDGHSPWKGLAPQSVCLDAAS